MRFHASISQPTALIINKGVVRASQKRKSSFFKLVSSFCANLVVKYICNCNVNKIKLPIILSMVQSLFSLVGPHLQFMHFISY